MRVLTRLIEKEHEAHTALGDAASLMGKYDVEAEEEEIRKVLAGQADLDDVVATPDEVAGDERRARPARAAPGLHTADPAAPAPSTPPRRHGPLRRRTSTSSTKRWTQIYTTPSRRR